MSKKEFPVGLALHQIPKDPENPVFRRLLVAPPGKWFIVADCNSQETHIMAEQSKDDKLLEIYAKDLDPHAVTASAISGLSYETIRQGYKDKEPKITRLRLSGKVKNLSGNFRCGIQNTYNQAHVKWLMHDVTIEEVTRWAVAWKSTYKGIPKYWNTAIFKARQKGYAETLAGRRFYINQWIENRKKSEASAIMFPIQGTGADMKYLAIAVMRQKFPELAFWEEIHDEVVYVSDTEPTYEYLMSIKRVLDTLPYKKVWGWQPLVPFTWKVQYGVNWGDLQ